MSTGKHEQDRTEAAPDRVASLFRHRFGHDPTVAHAPGRVNLIGEHVDYLDGVVLPMGIDRRAAVAIAPATDGMTTITAADLSLEYQAEGPPSASPVESTDMRFANHVLGVIAAAGEVDVPLSILVTSDVPPGAGVSSSAAIEVATGAALAECLGRKRPDPLQLALDAQKAEHAFVGTPCGIMDMLVSAAAEPGSALRIDCRDLGFKPIPLPHNERLGIMLINSGVTHRLSDGGYADRRAACERVVEKLGHSLRDATIENLEGHGIDPVDAKRARHVIGEIRRVDAAIDALGNDDLDGLGSIMLEGHASLRDLFEVSVTELDTIVESAASLSGSGCFGARMTGGGFGGSAIVLHEPAQADRIKEQIESDFKTRFGRCPDSMMVRASRGVQIESGA